MSHRIIGGDILSLDGQSIHTIIYFCDSVCSMKTNHTSYIIIFTMFLVIMNWIYWFEG